MNKEQLLEKLNSDSYNFLRNEECLSNNIMLLTTGGSIAYGTNVETSDIDIRSVYLNSRREILTMNCNDKLFEDKDTDTVIYPLKQMIQLLISNNPNVLEICGTKEDHLLQITKAGRLLRNNINLFLSKRVKHSFGGYATAQLRRLQAALARDNYPKNEKEKHILGSIQGQFEHFRNNYYKHTNGNIKLYLDKSIKKDFDEEIYIDINLNHYPLRDLKGIYSDMANVIKNYESLNHRNNKKDELHLNKHAMHLVRLLIMAIEILEGKGINTYRDYDRKFLLKFRNGDFVQQKDGKDDYSLVFEIVDEYEKKFKYACENTELPDEPKHKEIENLVIAINETII